MDNCFTFWFFSGEYSNLLPPKFKDDEDVMVQAKSAGGPDKRDVRFSDNRKTRAFDPDIGRYLIAWDQARPSKWSATFLPSTGICLMSLGITLVVIGGVRDQADLIVLGVIFIAGSLIFFTLMYTAVCRPYCHRNQVDIFTHIDEDEPAGSTSRPLSEPPPYSYRDEFSDDHVKRAKPKLVPRDSVLYEEKARQFMATPATTTDVNFSEGGETPPPPRIALPHGFGSDSLSFQDDVMGMDDLNDPGDPPPPPAVYNATVKKDAKISKEVPVVLSDGKSDKELNSLELL